MICIKNNLKLGKTVQSYKDKLIQKEAPKFLQKYRKKLAFPGLVWYYNGA